jgi:hypothetical protein
VLAGLIYVDAAIPDQGQNYLDLVHPAVLEALRRSITQGCYITFPNDWSCESFGVHDPQEQRKITSARIPLAAFEQPLRDPSSRSPGSRGKIAQSRSTYACKNVSSRRSR